jgi:hypothetical protein
MMSPPRQTWDIPLRVQLAYARRELDACRAAERAQPQLTTQEYAAMVLIKRAIILTLERLVAAEDLPA